MKISIAEDFSETPGARYISDGDFSGEAFYQQLLEPKFNEAVENNEDLIVDLDNTAGYATSFLDESFGGLARNYGKDKVLQTIKFISSEEPYLIEEITSYM